MKTLPYVASLGLLVLACTALAQPPAAGTQMRLRGTDGRWHASEVHIFPEEMRGAGEGHYPWDLPESTMTNAAVTGTGG